MGIVIFWWFYGDFMVILWWLWFFADFHGILWWLWFLVIFMGFYGDCDFWVIFMGILWWLWFFGDFHGILWWLWFFGDFHGILWWLWFFGDFHGILWWLWFFCWFSWDFMVILGCCLWWFYGISFGIYHMCDAFHKLSYIYPNIGWRETRETSIFGFTILICIIIHSGWKYPSTKRIALNLNGYFW